MESINNNPSNKLSSGCSILIIFFAFFLAFGFWNIFIAPTYDEVEIDPTDGPTEMVVSRNWFRLGSPIAIEYEVIGETRCNLKLTFIGQTDARSDVLLTPDKMNKRLRVDFYQGSRARIIYKPDSCQSQKKGSLKIRARII